MIALRFAALAALCWLAPAGAIAQTAVRIQFDQRLGPLEIDRFALGQGGLSEEPMWDARAAEIRALRPRIIRLFVQEYFDLLPARGKYHFDTLDQSVDLILRTGATPLMSIDFKPRALFPAINQDIVEPEDYDAWEELIAALVKHYKDRGAGIRYWEVSNEPDIGEDGGCPYRFKPESYVRYYQHTAAAIKRADPDARVGGPALANSKSAILPALLAFCAAGKAPLDFVSWHIYSSDPLRIRGTIEYVKALVAKHPSLKPETVLDEWNMSFGPPPDIRFQPCYIAETAYQMKEAGLDYSCYYHIRDYHVRPETFAKFMSPSGVALMTRWWNRNGQFHGLFDYQNTVRPSYFAFKLLSRLTGERLRVTSEDKNVHGFATYDRALNMYKVLLWNFANTPAQVDLTMENLPSNMRVTSLTLDAAAGGNDENVRLRPGRALTANRGTFRLDNVPLDPWGVVSWTLEPRK